MVLEHLRREQIVFKDINGDGVVDVVRTLQTSSLEELIQVSFGKDPRTVDH